MLYPRPRVLLAALTLYSSSVLGAPVVRSYSSNNLTISINGTSLSNVTGLDKSSSNRLHSNLTLLDDRASANNITTANNNTAANKSITVHSITSLNKITLIDLHSNLTTPSDVVLPINSTLSESSTTTHNLTLSYLFTNGTLRRKFTLSTNLASDHNITSTQNSKSLYLEHNVTSGHNFTSPAIFISLNSSSSAHNGTSSHHQSNTTQSHRLPSPPSLSPITTTKTRWQKPKPTPTRLSTKTTTTSRIPLTQKTHLPVPNLPTYPAEPEKPKKKENWFQRTWHKFTDWFDHMFFEHVRYVLEDVAEVIHKLISVYAPDAETLWDAYNSWSNPGGSFKNELVEFWLVEPDGSDVIAKLTKEENAKKQAEAEQINKEIEAWYFGRPRPSPPPPPPPETKPKNEGLWAPLRYLGDKISNPKKIFDHVWFGDGSNNLNNPNNWKDCCGNLLTGPHDKPLGEKKWSLEKAVSGFLGSFPSLPLEKYGNWLFRNPQTESDRYWTIEWWYTREELQHLRKAPE